MSICLRFSSNQSEARTIINDGFLKMFANLHTYDVEKAFHPWLRRIMSNTAIDHYRFKLKYMNLLDIAGVDEVFVKAKIERNCTMMSR